MARGNALPDIAEQRSTKRFLISALNICLPILAGLFIYLWYRPDTYLSGYVYRIIGRTVYPSDSETSIILQFLRGYAADILWAYALMFSVSAILGTGKKQMWAAAGICLCLVTLMECLQLTDFVSGTFDLLDILFESASTGLAVLIIHLFERGKTK